MRCVDCRSSRTGVELRAVHSIIIIGLTKAAAGNCGGFGLGDFGRTKGVVISKNLLNSLVLMAIGIVSFCIKAKRKRRLA